MCGTSTTGRRALAGLAFAVALLLATPATPSSSEEGRPTHAELVVVLPRTSDVLPGCAIAPRLYADGVPLACVEASGVLACGGRAQLAVARVLRLELVYGELARVDLGATTLQLGENQLVARGAVRYADADGDGLRDADQRCPRDRASVSLRRRHRATE